MEPGVFGLTQQTMEYMAHFVEESHNIVMGHQSGFLGSRLSKVSNHSGKRIATGAIRIGESAEETPDSSMGVLVL